MIIQADTVSGKAQACDGIQETCRESSKSAVAKRRFRLDLLDTAKLPALLPEYCLELLIDAEVDQVVGQQLSDQELC